MGMSDATARNQLLQSFRASKAREHKLELNAYLASREGSACSAPCRIATARA
jgi:hypothetical protein